jgi:hypothetical protein
VIAPPAANTNRAPGEGRPEDNDHDQHSARHRRAQLCELCGRPTVEKGAYIPTTVTGERVIALGVVTFPLCKSCQAEMKAGSPRAQCFLADLRNLALAPRGRA